MDHKQDAMDLVGDAGDAAAVVVTVGVFSEILPALAALFTVVWLGIRIWESDTVRSLTGRSGGEG